MTRHPISLHSDTTRLVKRESPTRTQNDKISQLLCQHIDKKSEEERERDIEDGVREGEGKREAS
jgi:hypothetical protein